MALDFPSSPTVGQTFPNPPQPGVPLYAWDGEKWTVTSDPDAGTGDYVLKAGDTMTGNLAIQKTSPVLILDDIGAGLAEIKYYRGGKQRWGWRMDNAAEGGGNAGSNLLLYAMDDAGVAGVGNPLTISRADSRLGLIGDPTAPLHAATKQYVDNKSVSGAYVLKTGDTMTGTLTNLANISVPNGTVSSYHVNASGNVQAGNVYSTYGMSTGTSGFNATSPGYDVVAVNAVVAGAPALYLQAIHQAGVRYFWRAVSGGPYFDFRSEGDATSQVGGWWVAHSDSRIKTVTGNYESGLDQIAALQPVRYTFKGNDTDRPPDQPVGSDEHGNPLPRTGDPGVAPYPASGHYLMATAATEYIGLVAQDVEIPMPELISKVAGYIDGTPVNDLRLYNGTSLVYALINAVKELKARVEVLETAAVE